jgi:hypothetical protein
MQPKHLTHTAILHPSSCDKYDLYAADAYITKFVCEVAKEALGEIEHNQKWRKFGQSYEI